MLGFEINLGVKRKGVDLRIVSDKRGKLSRLPDAVTYVHKPGSEVLLFKALSKVIVDENLQDAGAAGVAGLDELKKSLDGCAPEQVAEACGLAAADITALARDYAKAEKALILLPLGLGYPGHGKELAQALINLALLTGKLGKEGCGVLIMGEKNNSQGAADLGLYPATGKNAAAIIDGCATGAIKTLYVAGENPVVSYPDRKRVEAALDKVDFLIVQDLFLTETAAKADVVLPACSFAEKDGSFTSVGKAVQRVNRAIKPIGQARSDFEILNQLCAVLAGTPAYTDAAATFAEIAASVPAYQGMTLDALGDDGVVHEASGTSKFVAVTGAPVAAEAGKLALVTGSALNHCGTLSRFGEGPMYVCPEGYVELGREDASSLGIKEGDQVTVKSAGAEIRLKAKVGSRLPKGVVFAPYHFGDQSVNNLSTGAAVTWVSIGK